MKLFSKTTALVLILSLFSGCAFFNKISDNSINDPSEINPTANNLEHRKGTLVIHANPGDRIKIEQQRHEFWFGAAITNRIFDGEMSEADTAKFKEAFLENFNSAVTENALKWLDMQPTQDEVNYKIVDDILSWTDANNIPLRGHNIYWGIPKFVQPWLKQLDDDTLHATLKNRGTDIATRYKGRFAQYDLNNEMIHGNYYEDRFGETITLDMANWVKASDPDAKLFLNDYNVLTGNTLEKYLIHIKTLLDMGVPISGIGVQGHLHADSFNAEMLQSALDQLSQFGLPIIITEFNFPGQRSKYHKEPGVHAMTEENEIAKAQAIEDYYRICFSHPSVQGILMWGFWAGANWIPESSLYHKDWSPTPALKAYRDLIFKEWWTSVEVEVDEKGIVEVPAFFGDYKITLAQEVKLIELRKAEPSIEVQFE